MQLHWMTQLVYLKKRILGSNAGEIGLCVRSIYTTKIDGNVCPPNISETVAVRTVKLAHRPRIASTTIKFISKPILLSIL